MSLPDPAYDLTSLDALAALFGPTNENSLRKETSALTPAYRRWIEAAPFFAIATSGAGGLDCSPRGDPAGHLLHVQDDRTLLIPDRRGNNRLDTLKNLIADPRVALLFFAPGINETVRVNGRARLSTDPAWLERFDRDGKRPKVVLVVGIDAVYFQCARALARAGLWDAAARVDRSRVPTAGEMTKAADQTFDAVAYDAELPSRQKATLY